jgi:DNA-directed RNA polymerase specialized sigma54-like protein
MIDIPTSAELRDQLRQRIAVLESINADLLAALRYVAEDNDFICRCSDAANEKVRAAIAKAEGGAR